MEFFGFGLFGIMFTLVFVLVIGVFIVNISRSVKQWNKNNNSPRLTVNAAIVAKRMDVSRRYHGTGTDNWRTSATTYYVTFEVESGDRMELNVTGSEYGLLVEGDKGRVSFQGTRYLGFERE